MTLGCQPSELPVTITGGPWIEGQIPRATEAEGGFEDGWTVSFLDAQVSLVSIRLARPAAGSGIEEELEPSEELLPRRFELKKLGRHPVATFPAVSALEHHVLSFELAPLPPDDPDGASGPTSAYFSGTAISRWLIYGFRWGFEARIRVECRGLPESDAIHLRAAPTTLFEWTGDSAGGPTFGDLAAADINGDHTLDLAELDLVRGAGTATTTRRRGMELGLTRLLGVEGAECTGVLASPGR